ncbi:MAG: M14 family zinc carboxypeptidase, partial [Bacillota bacterium]
MSAHPELSFNHYATYDEMTRYLQEIAEVYPHLVTLSSIGQSYEGRDVWVVALTNGDTGPASSKPALYCDGNIHAGEVTPSMILLYA